MAHVCVPVHSDRERGGCADAGQLAERLARALRAEFPGVAWEVHVPDTGRNDEDAEPDEAHAYGP